MNRQVTVLIWSILMAVFFLYAKGVAEETLVDASPWLVYTGLPVSFQLINMYTHDDTLENYYTSIDGLLFEIGARYQNYYLSVTLEDNWFMRTDYNRSRLLAHTVSGSWIGEPRERSSMKNTDPIVLITIWETVISIN